MERYDRAFAGAMNGSGFRSGRKALHRDFNFRAHLVVAWGCMFLFLMSRAENGGVLMTSPIIAPDPCRNHPVNKVLTKRVVSSNLRMSILVGLGGSGHHYLMEAVTHIFKSNEEISEDTTPSITPTSYLTLATMDKSPLAYTEACQQATDEMHDLALREKSLPWPGHLVRLCSERSYPTGNGARKALHYIDMPMLAATAEAEEVDLRVIYLKRPAHDILVANTIHCHFQNERGGDMVKPHPLELFSKYVLILLTDATVMHSFLAEMEPAFIVCHDYGHAGEEEEAAKVANFVAPNPTIAKMYNSSLIHTWAKRPSKAENFTFQSSEAIISRLQRELDAFEYTYCG